MSGRRRRRSADPMPSTRGRMRRWSGTARLLFLLAGVLLATWLGVEGIRQLLGDGNGQSVQGVILQVEASSLTIVDSFTLRSNEGEVLVFEIAPDAARDPREGFVAGHLRSHAVLAQQVAISYREEDGRLLAERMEDK